MPSGREQGRLSLSGGNECLSRGILHPRCQATAWGQRQGERERERERERGRGRERDPAPNPEPSPRAACRSSARFLRRACFEVDPGWTPRHPHTD